MRSSPPQNPHSLFLGARGASKSKPDPGGINGSVRDGLLALMMTGHRTGRLRDPSPEGVPGDSGRHHAGMSDELTELRDPNRTSLTLNFMK